MSAIENDAAAIAGIGDEYKYGFHDESKPVIKVERGLNEDIIRQISAHKNEPEWMLDFRLKSYEIFQMLVLQPSLAILDETDSGLDIDALKIVAEGVKALVSPQMGALVITHYQRILNYITPDRVHVFVGGRIVASGGAELAHKLEADGYEAFIPATVGSES